MLRWGNALNQKVEVRERFSLAAYGTLTTAVTEPFIERLIQTARSMDGKQRPVIVITVTSVIST